MMKKVRWIFDLKNLDTSFEFQTLHELKTKIEEYKEGCDL